MKVVILPVINHLSWYVADCSRPRFSAQQRQEFEHSGSYKAGDSKLSSWTKSHVPICLAQKDNKKNCLPKQTLQLTKFSLVVVSSSHIRNFYYWMMWKLEFYCLTLLKNFIVKTQTFQTFTLLYLTLLVYLQLWFWIKMSKPKREEARSFPKYDIGSCKGCTRKVVLFMGPSAI